MLINFLRRFMLNTENPHFNNLPSHTEGSRISKKLIHMPFFQLEEFTFLSWNAPSHFAQECLYVPCSADGSGSWNNSFEKGFGPAVPPLVVYLTKCVQLFTPKDEPVHSSTVCKSPNWKLSSCPRRVEWINKLCTVTGWDEQAVTTCSSMDESLQTQLPTYGSPQDGQKQANTAARCGARASLGRSSRI